jgi:hypothetical protein
VTRLRTALVAAVALAACLSAAPGATGRDERGRLRVAIGRSIFFDPALSEPRATS